MENTQINQEKYAGFLVRLVAVIIDILIVAIPLGILVGIITVASGTTNPQSYAHSSVFSWGTLFVEWLYFIIMTHTKGATLGKMLVGITVKSANGQPLSIGQIILRETLGRIIAGIILCIGYILAAFTSKKQGLHDMIAKTVVVYKDPTNTSKTGLIIGIVLASVLFLVPLFFTAISIIGLLSIMSKNGGKIPGADSYGQVLTDTASSADVSPEVQNFTIDFPGMPTHTTKVSTISSLNIKYPIGIYSYAKTNSEAYIVEHAQYPITMDFSVPKEILQASLDGEVKSLEGVISSSTLKTFGKYPALEYQLYSKQNGIHIRGKNIMIGNELYEIGVFYTGAAPKDIDVFINSFKLK
jgi:uncharacterized RDD family membrane protein YckC